MKYLSIPLVFIILLTIFIISNHAFALIEEYYQFEYKIENGEVEILSYNSNLRKVVIPSTVKGYPVTKFHPGAFHDCVKVTLPESLDSLGELYFQDCPYLKCVVIPKSVKSVSIRTFDDCPKLKTLYFQGRPPEIQYSDYHDNCLKDRMLTIYVPENKGWANSVWNHPQSNVRMLIIPNGLDNHLEYRLIDYGKIALTNYNLYFSGVIPPTINGNLITEIDDSYFKDHGEEDVESTLYIPHGVEKIGGSMYKTRFIAFEVDIENQSYTSLDGVLFNKDMTRLICFPVAQKRKHQCYSIPKDVTVIGDHAFDGYNPLQAINLPPKLVSIGKYAFANCKHLTYMYIPASVRFIHDNAFKNCINLSEVIFLGKPPLMDMTLFPTPCNFFVPKDMGWGNVTPPQGIKLIFR